MHILTRMNVMLDFICMGSVGLEGTQEKRKYKMKKILAQSRGRIRSLMLYRLSCACIAEELRFLVGLIHVFNSYISA